MIGWHARHAYRQGIHINLGPLKFFEFRTIGPSLRHFGTLAYPASRSVEIGGWILVDSKAAA